MMAPLPLDPTGPYGPTIRAARERAGYTQVELASLLGVDQRTVSGWEISGFTPSTLDVWRQLTGVLELVLTVDGDGVRLEMR